MFLNVTRDMGVVLCDRERDYSILLDRGVDTEHGHGEKDKDVTLNEYLASH